MKNKFGFGEAFALIAVTAVYSKVFVDYSDTWLSCLIQFIELFILNLFGIGIVYSLGESIETKVKSTAAAWIIIAAAVAIAFILCLIYMK